MNVVPPHCLVPLGTGPMALMVISALYVYCVPQHRICYRNSRTSNLSFHWLTALPSTFHSDSSPGSI